MDKNICDNTFTAESLKVISDIAAASVNTHMLTEKVYSNSIGTCI